MAIRAMPRTHRFAQPALGCVEINEVRNGHRARLREIAAQTGVSRDGRVLGSNQ